jgi:branched-chain amino acid aminotransferase
MKITKINNSKIDKVDFNNLEFGKIFSDHMVVCVFKDGKWNNAEIKEYQPLNLNPATHVLHYGQAVFEGMKAYSTKNGETLLFRPLENIRRLNQSAKRLCMPEIDESVFMDCLTNLINLDKNWIPKKENQSLYIRPFMIATSEFIRATPADEYTFCIITSPAGKYYAGDSNLKIEERFARSSQGGVGFAKAAGNYAAAFAPTKEAQKNGFTQVVWTDAKEHKYIEESGTMNIMFLIDDVIITPKLSDSILGGITRDSILEIARNKGIKVEERKISIIEILEAYDNNKISEVFGVGTAVTVNPINSITYRDKVMNFQYSSESICLKLKSYLLDIQYGIVKDENNWTVKL